jgi:hypothetical protein
MSIQTAATGGTLKTTLSVSTGDFTAMCWYKSPGTSSDDTRAILGMNTDFVLLFNSSSGWLLYDGANHYAPFVPVPLKWYHCAIVRKAGVRSAFINGRKWYGETTASDTGVIEILSDSWSDPSLGSAAWFKYWGRALSSTEIVKESKTSLAASRYRLLSEASLSGNHVQGLHDTSGNGNHIVVAGGGITTSLETPVVRAGVWRRDPAEWFWIAKTPSAGGGGITGALDQTLGAITSSAAGTVRATGALSQTLPAITISAAGSARATGTLSQTLPAITISAAGSARATGTLAQTLPAITISAAGSARATGTLAQTLPAITISSAGKANVAGALAQTLGAITSSAAGTVAVAGSASQAIGSITISATGVVGNTNYGTLTQTLGAVGLSSAGTVSLSGTLAQEFGAITVSGAGAVRVSGTAALALGSMVTSAFGAILVRADGVVVIPTIGVLATGYSGDRSSAPNLDLRRPELTKCRLSTPALTCNPTAN